MRATATTSGSAGLAYVIDTSVLTKFFLDDEDLVEKAQGLFRAYRDGLVELVAAFPLFYELPQTLLKAGRMRRITAEGARNALDVFTRLPLVRVSLSDAELGDLLRRSYRIAELIQRSFYDSLFVATAERLGIALLTADEPTANASRGQFDVVHLKDFELP